VVGSVIIFCRGGDYNENFAARSLAGELGEKH
jgi:hypothetical protein